MANPFSVIGRELGARLLPRTTELRDRRDQLIIDTALNTMQMQIQQLSEVRDESELKAAIGGINKQFGDVTKGLEIDIPKGHKLIPDAMRDIMSNRMANGVFVQGELAGLLGDFYSQIFDSEVPVADAITSFQGKFFSNPVLASQAPDKFASILQFTDQALREERNREFQRGIKNTTQTQTAMNHLNGLMPTLINLLPETATLYSEMMDKIPNLAWQITLQDFGAQSPEALQEVVAVNLGTPSASGDGLNQINEFIRIYRQGVVGSLSRNFDRRIDSFVKGRLQRVKAAGELAKVGIEFAADLERGTPGFDASKVTEGETLLTIFEQQLDSVVRQYQDSTADERAGEPAQTAIDAFQAMVRTGIFDTDLVKYSEFPRDEILEGIRNGDLDELIQRPIEGADFTYEELLFSGDAANPTAALMLKNMDIVDLQDPALLEQVFALRGIEDMGKWEGVIRDITARRGEEHGITPLLERIAPGAADSHILRSLTLPPPGIGVPTPVQRGQKTVGDLDDDLSAVEKDPETPGVAETLFARDNLGAPHKNPIYLQEVAEIQATLRKELDVPLLPAYDTREDESEGITDRIDRMTSSTMANLGIDTNVITDEEIMNLSNSMEAALASASEENQGLFSRAAERKLMEGTTTSAVQFASGQGLQVAGQKIRETGTQQTRISSLQPIGAGPPVQPAPIGEQLASTPTVSQRIATVQEKVGRLKPIGLES